MDSVSWRALMSLAGSIVLGMAISKTGIAQVAALAVTAMFFPIMYHAAEQVGYEPTPFLLALMIAANASYATPIAASPNMLVYGPGGYRFTDYMRIGIPLTLIVTITGVAAVVLTYPLVKLN